MATRLKVENEHEVELTTKFSDENVNHSDDDDVDITPSRRRIQEEKHALLTTDIHISTSDDNTCTIQEHHHQRLALSTLEKARRLLYLSHLFAQFSEISWQFCLTIFLAALTNYQSLFLVSTYGLTTGLAVTLLGSTTGSLVDKTNRLVAARGFILTENICVVTATIFCFVLLSSQTQNQQEKHQVQSSSTTIPNDVSSIILIVGIHILGATARVLDEGFLVAIERDWVVVMSRSVSSDNNGSNTCIDDKDQQKQEEKQETMDIDGFNSRTWLSETNVSMKQIDLSGKVVAPAISGFFIALVDNRRATTTTFMGDPESDNIDLSNGSQFRYAAVAVGAINALALIVEYYCTSKIYQLIPDLEFLVKHGEQCNDDDDDDDDSDRVEEFDDEECENSSNNRSNHRETCNTKRSLSSCCSSMVPFGVRVYFEQKTALAGLGMAMLYLNALTFDAIFTAYLAWRDMGMGTIGIWRGISSAIGLVGTCVYHWSVKRMSLELTGMLSIIYEFLCLSLSYASLFIDDNHISLVMLIAGVCASRIGLWVFDIAVTQMMQEYVPDGVRGVVGGQQQSLNAFFNLLSYALGIVFPDPNQFFIYVTAGYASVGIAMLLYGGGTYYPAKHK